MKQITKNGHKCVAKPKNKKSVVRKPSSSVKKVRRHPKYGTSKLEERFAKEFLDKLGLKYYYQFEAADIGRFYDFAVECKGNGDGSKIILIEVDGSYYHSDPRIVNEDKMSSMQKRNKMVDALKDKWAALHGIPLLRIWEKDINDNPSKVLDELRKRFYIEKERVILDENKAKRHKNKFK